MNSGTYTHDTGRTLYGPERLLSHLTWEASSAQ